VGVHVAPEAEFVTQFPIPALRILGVVVHIAVQLPESDQAPKVHVAERVPVYPELQIGVHVVPEAELIKQSPVPAFEMLGREAQEVEVQVPVVDQEPEEHVAERVPVYPVLHTGTHVVPEAAPETQFPAPAFVIVGVPPQLVEVQVPVGVQVPELQFAERVPEYPELQVGTQVVPDADPEIQFPGPAFAIDGVPAQLVEVQVPVGVQVPELQVAERVPVYPELQVGTHVVPEAAPETQFPAPALAIVGRPVHAVEVQVPVGVQVPVLQVAERVPVYPVLHAGTHMVPEAAPETQFPAPAFAIVGVPAQLVEVQVPVGVHVPELQVAERVPV
jgi:hypothetical protein